MPDFSKKEPVEAPIYDVTRAYKKAHDEKTDAEGRMATLKAKFFSLIKIPETDLARTTVFYDGQDPENHVATLYPKWRIVSKDFDLGRNEWRLLIEEDPEKKTYQYVNPVDKLVYERQVRESAPAVDLARLKADHPALYRQMTFQPKPPRELKPLEDLDEKQKSKLMNYLLPVKLTNAMSKPRKAKAEELEGLK